MTNTPMSAHGLAQFDHLLPEEAIFEAWTNPIHIDAWHQKMQQEVRERMPLLARSIGFMLLALGATLIVLAYHLLGRDKSEV